MMTFLLAFKRHGIIDGIQYGFIVWFDLVVLMQLFCFVALYTLFCDVDTFILGRIHKSYCL